MRYGKALIAIKGGVNSPQGLIARIEKNILVRISVWQREFVMSQITLYLDDATQALVDQAAQANGVSKSRWVADIIRKYASHEWPQDCLNLAGRFADFPLREQGSDQPADVPRVGF
jgi:hypothetical protein